MDAFYQRIICHDTKVSIITLCHKLMRCDRNGQYISTPVHYGLVILYFTFRFNFMKNAVCRNAVKLVLVTICLAVATTSFAEVSLENSAVLFSLSKPLSPDLKCSHHMLRHQMEVELTSV